MEECILTEDVGDDRRLCLTSTIYVPSIPMYTSMVFFVHVHHGKRLCARNCWPELDATLLIHPKVPVSPPCVHTLSSIGIAHSCSLCSSTCLIDCRCIYIMELQLESNHTHRLNNRESCSQAFLHDRMRHDFTGRQLDLKVWQIAISM